MHENSSELLSEMVIFAKVVEQRNLSAAARQLGLTSSAVSRNVARLEAEMGAQLLYRNTRSVTPTELGKHVYDGCALIAKTARDVRAVASEHADQPTGRLFVTAPVGFGQRWLMPRLPAFLERWPKINMRLILIDRLVDLVDEGFDLALRITTTPSPGLVARPLLSTSYVLVASKDYLVKRGIPQVPTDLMTHSCIVLGYGAFDDKLSLFPTSGGSYVRTQVSGSLTVNNGAAILSAAEAGVGIGLLPDFTAQAALDAETVVRLLPDWSLGPPYEKREVYAVYAPTRRVSHKVRALIDHLVLTA